MMMMMEVRNTEYLTISVCRDDWSLEVVHFSKAFYVPHSFSGFRFVSGLIHSRNSA